MQQKIDELSESLVQMWQDNSVLMANQEVLGVYKNNGVPTEIPTKDGALVAPGLNLAGPCS